MSEVRANLLRMMPNSFPIFFERRKPYEGQAAAMPEIVRGHDVLFASPTASGKTEAVVTPLFQRHLSFQRQALSTVYVAPTKALVNDLHERLVEALGTRYPSAVRRYTGDRHELGSASGGFCVLVTPEALDSLQLRRPEALANIRAVIIDEIHLLHGQPRGQQLRHVIDRIRQASKPVKSQRDNFQIVGMTATLDDIYTVSHVWLGKNAKVLTEGSPRQIDSELLDISTDPTHDPYLSRAQAIVRWLDAGNLEKLLIFTNSRNAAHSLAAYLHRELDSTRWPVHLHFGALAASHRERVEEEMRSNKYGVCVATSTLEIGIDIGDIDTIILADLPATVSAFLQRIGRGNRRSGVCRVVGFRSSDEDERIFRSLIDCSQRGELDDAYEYDRASVRFQQIVSLCWRATRQDRALTLSELAKEAGTTEHNNVVEDMIDTGCLSNIKGALIPCDRLVDSADAGLIHTVISGHIGNPVLDSRTGEPAMHDTGDPSLGDAIFVDGSLRRLMQGTDGTLFLTDNVSQSRPLARIKATGAGIPLSRSVVWGLARQLGHDPTIWQLFEDELRTWGGEIFNRLIAAFLERSEAGTSFTPLALGIGNSIPVKEFSIEDVHDWATQTEKNMDLPLNIAEKFTNPSRFLGELSNELAAKEKRRSVPWSIFHRWLGQIKGIERIE